MLACADRPPTLDADGGEIEPTLQRVSPGVGLFTSLAFNGQSAVIAYQQRTKAGTAPADGDLYALTVASDGTASAPVLIDGSGDTGARRTMNIIDIGVVEWNVEHLGPRVVRVRIVKEVSSVSILGAARRVDPDVGLEVRMIEIDAVVDDGDHDRMVAAADEIPRADRPHVL